MPHPATWDTRSGRNSHRPALNRPLRHFTPPNPHSIAIFAAIAVREITIASNLLDMFATLKPVNDLTLRRGIDSPTILIPDMMVAAA